MMVVTYQEQAYKLLNDCLVVEDQIDGECVVIPRQFLHDFMGAALQYEMVEELETNGIMSMSYYNTTMTEKADRITAKENREFINKSSEEAYVDVQTTSGRGAPCDPEDKRDIERKWTADELRDSEDPYRIRWTKSGTTKRDPEDPVG